MAREKPTAAPASAEPFGEAVTREPRLSDKIAEMMRQAIISRGLTAGTPLPSERELGEQFGVSRTVVREAVRALVAKGIVEVRSGSGLRVAAANEGTVSDSFAWYIRGGHIEYPQVHEIRSMIEVVMAGLAAERRTDEQLVVLREAHAHLTSVIDDVEEAALADLTFHDLIARATQNDLFAVILGSITNALVEVRRETLAAGSGEQTIADHEQILAAIEAGDPAAAREAMAEHLKDVHRHWEGLRGEAPAGSDGKA
jgi:GntR family transcriptional regulator, transcriptional repressor for pyruvate dehydrogenase complex